jgi:hypothetical protein
MSSAVNSCSKFRLLGVTRAGGAWVSRKPEPGPRRGGLTRDLHSIVVILRGLLSLTLSCRLSLHRRRPVR